MPKLYQQCSIPNYTSMFFCLVAMNNSTIERFHKVFFTIIKGTTAALMGKIKPKRPFHRLPVGNGFLALRPHYFCRLKFGANSTDGL